MLRSPQFLVGLAAGAVVTWFVARRRQAQLIAATPYTTVRLKRRGRLGHGWSGPGGGGSYR